MITADTPQTMGDYFAILRRRRVYLITIIPGALLLSTFIAFTLTPYYRSSATILLEAAEMSENLAESLSSYADQQFELIQRRVLTPENLESLVKEFDPYPDEPKLSARAKARQIIADTQIERVDPVTLEPLEESSAFSIHYLNTDAERAATVAQKLSDLFLDYNRQSRAARATAAYQFLLAQSTEVTKAISEVDTRIAQFKLRNPDALPEAQLRTEGAAERTAQNLFDVESQLRRAAERRSLLDVQLSKIPPTLGSTGSAQSELATLQGQLAEARVRYTADHPDVKRLQRQIQALAAEAAANPANGRIVPNNPDYIAVQGQLEAAESEIAALQRTAARERARLQQLEHGAATAPRVEREYAELTRERDALQGQFDDLQKRLREADISQNLEVEQRGDRFTQIRAPTVADMPYFPNRLGIILLGVLVGSALAAALVAFSESTDASVRSSRDLAMITELPVIASVPTMLGDVDLRKRRVWRVSYTGALIVATVAVVIAVLSD